MRTRVQNYKITMDSNNNRVLVHIPTPPVEITAGDEADTIEQAIRLIVDEDAAIVFCSSMQKRNIVEISASSEMGYAYYISFAIPTGKTVTDVDFFTVEMDWGIVAPEDIMNGVTYVEDALTTHDASVQSILSGMGETMIELEQSLRAPQMVDDPEHENCYYLVLGSLQSVNENNLIV